MNSANLAAFYACVQTGNFTTAAKRLAITQSALSQRIKNLEASLETTLLIRDRAGLKLTEAGEEVVRYCQSKQAAEDELYAKLKIKGGLRAKPPGLSGMIRIGGYSSVNRSCILPALAPLLRSHPDLSVRLVTKEVHELKPLLQSGEIDFMILDQEFTRVGIIALLLGYEKNALVKKRGFTGPEIYLDHDEADETTLRYLKKKAPALLNRRFLDDVYGLRDGVKLGLGFAVLPLHLISDEPGIEVIDATKVMKNAVYLHYYEQAYYSQVHQAVVQALKTALTSCG